MLDDLRIAENWLAEGVDITIAIVAETWGSAPRQAGSLLIVHPSGKFAGSVSGGCVEASVIAAASALSTTTPSKELCFTVSSETAWAAGLACGGQIRIWLFFIPHQLQPSFQLCLKTVSTDRKAATLTFPKTAHSSFAFTAENLPEQIAETETHLVLSVPPRLRLFITGATHIAQFLATAAQQCGFDVSIIDPRAIFTDDRSFGGVTVIKDWPDEYFAANPLGTDCALVTLTHDPKIDDAALVPALASTAFYIGCLGSKKTHTDRLKRLAEKAPTATLSRIHGPVGLDIGAKTPAEIAVAILAEMIKAQRARHEV